jgi:transposase-like protein
MVMKNAISMVFSESWHGLCTFHIMQNVVKHLARMERDESSALVELSACMYEYEDVKAFEETFSSLRSKSEMILGWVVSINKRRNGLNVT